MARYMKRNEGTEAPSNLVFFDTESYREEDPEKPGEYCLRLRLWAATRVRREGGELTRRRDEWGKDTASFWQFIDDVSDDQHCTWIFAHNLAFDLTQVAFWGKLDDGTFTTKPLYRRPESEGATPKHSWNGRIVAERHPCFMSVRRGKRTYKFVDTYNYWPKGLEAVAEAIGLKKVPLPKWEADDVEWLERCNQDVAIIEHAVTELIARWTEEDCGVFQMTAASLAMANFRHTCPIRTPDGKSVDIVCEPGSEAHELEREAYYGGRWQCFQVGAVNERVYHLDVNGLYPFVMMTHHYPRRFAGRQEEMSHATLANKIRCYDCVARVLINSRGETFPVRIGGVQYHAYGKFFTSLCGPELQRALESDSVARIHCVQWYSRAPIFEAWVKKWWARKLAAAGDIDRGAGDYEFSKLILNSLSGKFAQHGRYWTDIPDEIPLDPWGGWPEMKGPTGTIVNKRGLGKLTQFLKHDTEPAHSFPLISAMISAYGREYMRSLIATCPEGSVYYQGCDSIICDSRAYRALSLAFMIDPFGLGAMKVVETVPSAYIRCANDYTLGNKRTAAGWAGKLLASGRTDGKVEIWEGMPGLIAGGPKHSVRVTEVPVSEGVPTYKGIIDSSGRWCPHCLIDSEDWRGGPPKDGYRREYFSDMPEGRTQPTA